MNNNQEKIERIKTLTKELEQYCIEYYKYDNPSISDSEYDKLFDELKMLEEETGFCISTSPTQKVKGYILEGFEKVKHSIPMLSAKKTKSDVEVFDFIKKGECVASYKLDGLTVVLRYNDGKLIQAITRGNGEMGEDITETAKMISNIPLNIPFKGELELRGEVLISHSTFNRLSSIPEYAGYTHPRNLAAGTLRQLDTSVVKERNLEFYAFALISNTEYKFTTRVEEYDFLGNLGFDVVYYTKIKGDYSDYLDTINTFTKDYELPVDGVIIRYNDVAYAKSLGSTGHHTQDMIAKKWEDEVASTILRDIEWDTGKTGAISPVAVFDPVILDDTTVTRASLHNVSILQGLQLGIGDTIWVAKMNMIIPQVVSNDTKSNNYKVPTVCPVCGQLAEERKEEDVTVLVCTNKDCKGQKLGKFKTFVSRDGINVEGLSESILSRFIDLGYLNNFSDLFTLHQYSNEIIELEGFGKKSWEKLYNAINKAKDCELSNLITALSIPTVGKSVGKLLAKEFVDIEDFIARGSDFEYSNIDTIGEIMENSIQIWMNNKDNQQILKLLSSFMNITNSLYIDAEAVADSKVNGKTVVITGTFINYSRNELTKQLESMGAKVTGSISKKTDLLFCGENAGSKLTKAISLGITVVTENDLKEYILE